MPYIFFPDYMARFNSSQPSLNRFEKVKQLFQFGAQPKESASHPELQQMKGRIHDLQDSANDLARQLRVLYKELSHELDPELQSYFGSIIGPLIHEFECLQKKADKADTLVDSVHIQEKYGRWIFKARDLLNFFENNPRDREAIVKAVVRHTGEIAMHIVDREMGFVRSYLETRLHELSMSPAERLQLRMKIEESLTPYLETLKSLRGPKEDLSLEDLGSWKFQISEKCGDVTHACMDVIDVMIKEAEKARLPDIAAIEDEQVNFLEKAAPKLLQALRQQSPSLDEFERRRWQAELYLLEDQAQRIEQDISLDPPVYQRLKGIKSVFKKAQKLIDERSHKKPDKPE